MPTTTPASRVDFYLDPGCPWTWLTSRWLVDVADERSLEVRWLPFSLTLLNEGRPVPPAFDTPEFRERKAIGQRALAVITALGDHGDHGRAGRFYTEFGRRFHDREPLGDGDPVDTAAGAAGVPAQVVEAATSGEVETSIRAGLPATCSTPWSRCRPRTRSSR